MLIVTLVILRSVWHHLCEKTLKTEYKLTLLCFKIKKKIWKNRHARSTFQNFFTFTLLPGNSALPQTPEYDPSEYHPSAQSPVVRAFSYQAPTIWNQLPVSVRHSTALSSCKNLPETPLVSIVNREIQETLRVYHFFFLQHLQDAKRVVLSKFRDKVNECKKKILMYKKNTDMNQFQWQTQAVP